MAHGVRSGASAFTDHSALVVADPARDGPKTVV